MRDSLLILVILAYGLVRPRMPLSWWEQAPDLHGYLLGAMGPPFLDLLAFIALALYVTQRFRRYPRAARLLAAVVLLGGLWASGRALVPLLRDLREARPMEVVIVEKLPGQEIVIKHSTRDAATASVRLPNSEQYRRVPLMMPVELRVARRVGVAQVVGVLE